MTDAHLWTGESAGGNLSAILGDSTPKTTSRLHTNPWSPSQVDSIEEVPSQQNSGCTKKRQPPRSLESYMGLQRSSGDLIESPFMDPLNNDSSILSSQSIGSGVRNGKIAKHIADQIISVGRKSQSAGLQSDSHSQDKESPRSSISMNSQQVSSSKPGINSKELSRSQASKLLQQNRDVFKALYTKETPQQNYSTFAIEHNGQGSKNQVDNRISTENQPLPPPLSPFSTEENSPKCGTNTSERIKKKKPALSSPFMDQALQNSVEVEGQDSQIRKSGSDIATTRSAIASHTLGQTNLTTTLEEGNSALDIGDLALENKTDLRLSNRCRQPEGGIAYSEDQNKEKVRPFVSWRDVKIEPKSSLSPHSSQSPASFKRKNSYIKNWWKKRRESHEIPEAIFESLQRANSNEEFGLAEYEDVTDRYKQRP